MSALATCDRQLNDLARFLRERADVAQVERSATFGPGPAVDLYADAQLVSGESVLWTLWVYFRDGEWTIDANVMRSHADGQDPIREFPETHASGGADLAAQIASASEIITGYRPISSVVFPGEGYGSSSSA